MRRAGLAAVAIAHGGNGLHRRRKFDQIHPGLARRRHALAVLPRPPGDGAEQAQAAVAAMAGHGHTLAGGKARRLAQRRVKAAVAGLHLLRGGLQHGGGCGRIADAGRRAQRIVQRPRRLIIGLVVKSGAGKAPGPGLEQQGGAGIGFEAIVPPGEQVARGHHLRIRVAGAGGEQGGLHPVGHQRRGGELAALEFGEIQPIIAHQQPGRHLGAQAHHLGGGDMGRVFRRIEHARNAVHPRHVIGVLDEAAGRIEQLGQALIGLDLVGDEIGAVAGDDARPEGVAAARLVAGQDAVGDVEHMPRPVGIDDVEAGDLQALEGAFPAGKIMRLAHVEIGLEHARPIEPGNADCNGLAGDIEHRAVHAVAHDEGFALQAAVALADEQGLGDAAIGENPAIEAVATGRRFQRVTGGAQHGVDRVGEAQIIVEGKAQHRQAHLRGAIDAVTRRGDLRLVIGERGGRPRQVRVGQQHGRAAGRTGRADRPAVGAAIIAQAIVAGRFGRRQHAAHRRHIEELHQPVGVADDVHPGDGQHALQIGGHMIGMGGQIGVDAGGKAIEVGAHLRGLRLVPGTGALRHVMRDQIAIERCVFRPPIFRCPRPAFAVHPEQDIAVARRLRPAKALEGAGLRVGLDVGHAIAIPQDLVGQRRGGAGQRQGKDGTAHRRPHFFR